MKTTLEKVQVSEDLVYKIQISPDEEIVYLNVNFMNGRFIVEKSFRNNYDGLDKLKKSISLLDTEEKVITYLKIENLEGVGKSDE